MDSTDNIVRYVSFTIANNSNTNSTPISTGLISTGKWQLIGIEFPIMTSTSATLTGCRTADGTFLTLFEVGGGQAYPITVGNTARFVPIDPRITLSFPFYKIVTGSTELAERTCVAHLRRIQ